MMVERGAWGRVRCLRGRGGWSGGCNLDAAVARAGAALDGGGDEGVEGEFAHDEFQHAEDGLAGLAVGGDDVAGEGVGGFAEAWGECVADHGSGVGEAVVLFEESDGGFGGDVEAFAAEVLEGWEGLDDPGHDADFAVGDGAVGGGDEDHGADQRFLCVQSCASEHVGFFPSGHGAGG